MVGRPPSPFLQRSLRRSSVPSRCQQQALIRAYELALPVLHSARSTAAEAPLLAPPTTVPSVPLSRLGG